ncbi:MAG TPA: hypothetical protein VE987_10840, partial [Polyangiaceae bacterium]|nr:hypothetical protein [Polyangiaceae bacterium]
MRRGFTERTYGDDDWFSIVKRHFATQLVEEEDPISSRTLHLARSTEMTGEPTFLWARAERTMAISPGAFARFYSQYLTADRARALVVRPLAGAVGPAAVADSPAGGGTRELREATPPAPSASEVRAWMRPPGVALARRATLRNDLEVVALRRPHSTFHAVVRAFRGGHVDEQMPGVGVASLWAKERLKMSAATWGVAYRDKVDADTTYEVLQAAASDVDFTLKELDDENTFRVFWPPRQFSSRMQAYEAEERSADAQFDRRLRAALYGSHPYGREATIAEIHAVTPRAVDVFLDSIRRPRNGLVVIVADVDPSTAVRIAASRLDRGGDTSAPEPTLASVPALERSAAGPGERLIVQDRPGSDSARMRFMCALPRVEAQAWGATEVSADAVTMRLRYDLRERTASSYAISSEVRILRGGTAVFDLEADVDHSHLPQAIRVLRRFVEQPASAQLDED